MRHFCDDDGTEILYWLCRCGRRHEVPAPAPNTSDGVFRPESALYKDKK